MRLTRPLQTSKYQPPACYLIRCCKSRHTAELTASQSYVLVGPCLVGMPQQSSSVSAADIPDELPLSINSLSYAYPGALPVISDFTLQLPRGSRCLLLGANGAGEITSQTPAFFLF